MSARIDTTAELKRDVVTPVRGRLCNRRSISFCAIFFVKIQQVTSSQFSYMNANDCEFEI